MVVESTLPTKVRGGFGFHITGTHPKVDLERQL